MIYTVTGQTTKRAKSATIVLSVEIVSATTRITSTMRYITMCGHLVEEEHNAMVVSEDEWGKYTHLYLVPCPVCGDRNPHMTLFDEELSDEVQSIVLKIEQLTTADLRIPTYQNPVRTIRVRPIEGLRQLKRLERDELVSSVEESDDSILITLSQ